MIVDPSSLTRSAMYRFMISVVIPRPIAFVSTISPAGLPNLAPFSYFNAITSRPPLVGISIDRRGDALKDTLRNILDTGEFVVNGVNAPLAERMVYASGDWGAEVSEFERTGLTPVPSDLVRPPRVRESPIQMECRLHREIGFGDTTMVVGEILRVHVADEVLTDGRVDPQKLAPVGRLGGDGYTIVREVMHIPRPKVAPPE